MTTTSGAVILPSNTRVPAPPSRQVRLHLVGEPPGDLVGLGDDAPDDIGRRFDHDLAFDAQVGHGAQPQLLTGTLLGYGAALSPSSPCLRLSRYDAQAVVQWCMNSTRSRQPRFVKSTTVSSPSARRSKVKIVSFHSAGPPSAPRHMTRLGLVSPDHRP